MREVIATLDTIEQKLDAYTIALRLWRPGANFRDLAVQAAAMVLEGKTLETLETSKA